VTYVIGIDPGPVVGIVGLWTDRPLTPDIIQCTAPTLESVLSGLYPGSNTVLAVEQFVVGPLAARGNNPQAGALARSVIRACEFWAERRGVMCHVRSAAEVKPWATDTRLTMAGLWAPTKGMRHARDAARHALFAAVKDCGLPDPLSQRKVGVPMEPGGMFGDGIK